MTANAHSDGNDVAADKGKKIVPVAWYTVLRERLGGHAMAMVEHTKILRNPKFQELVRRRSSFAWTLAAVMLVIYLGFILAVAFARDLMAMKVGSGVASFGILAGLAVILAAFLLTGIYVWRANTRFDDLTRDLRKELG
jgi:uncharacterized membrane protein (DUF485 family)